MPRHPDRDDGIKPCTGPKRRRECAAGKDDIRGSERTKKERVLGTKTKEAAAAPRGGKGGRPFSAVKRSARHARCPFASTGIKRGGVAGARRSLPFPLCSPTASSPGRRVPGAGVPLGSASLAGPPDRQASPRRGGQHTFAHGSRARLQPRSPNAGRGDSDDEASAGQREERTRAVIEIEIPR